ncbi:MAG TPA: M15 family metallopeptidase [Fimbriimonas sp.]|nr:M15 family metallopeptidase [Fimbriimonas sp.]
MRVREPVKWDRTKGRPEPIHLLNRIVERENSEPLVDLAVVAPSVVVLRPAVIPFLRRQVAEMLETAASSLSEQYKIGVIDAWRPFPRQQRIYDFVWNCAKEAFPDRDHKALRRTVCRWVAPTDQKAPPGHCTGAAVDVWLLDANNNVLDVTAPFDRFGAAPTYSYGLTDEAFRNRTILVETMLKAGFSNCRDEWWHYSWGDAGWAVRMGLTECCYGRIDLDPSEYEEQERLWLETLKDRVNPFLVQD